MRRKLFYSFLILLAASYVWRWIYLPDTGPPKPGQHMVSLPAIDGDRELSEFVKIAYRQFEPLERPDAPVIVIVHGSPGSSGQVQALARTLANDFRVIIPDLPGFGSSSRKIPDYSIDAHARYLAALLNALEIKRFNLVGFSMGGGVILHLAELEPEKVSSLTLLSSIGVQELELMGDHFLNHGVHGVQLVGLWIVQNLVPHFGYVDDAMLNLSYARNFFDSDQRPLRAILEQIDIPVLIVHGKNDVLVPYSAAIEHRRIVPQSELITVDRNHFFVFRDPTLAADPIREFVDEVEGGQGLTRSKATPERLASAARPFDWNAQPKPISNSTFMVLLALGTLITEDLTCISTGILASKGVIPFWAGVLACTVGIIIGDGLLYVAGRLLGRDALRKRPFRWVLSESRVEQSTHFFHQYGLSLILITRFIPGTRLPTYFAAGLLGTSAWKFALYFAIASILWTPLLVGVAYLIGGKMLSWFQQYEGYSFLGLLLILLILWLIVRIAFPLCSWRGRRLLLGKWRRTVRWEFWPSWAFYPPVILFIIWLGLKYRSLTLFTASNPGIPAGGVALESKSAILSKLGNNASVAKFTLISADLQTHEKLEALNNFISESDLNYPIVLKPDIGERGQGVAIVEAKSHAQSYFDNCPHDIIAQEYVGGIEYGIFYYRMPNEDSGHIFSITEKELLAVKGDGHSTLEELILKDDRAVCMAPTFFDKLATELDNVPAEGYPYQLTKLGTHCRGAVFRNGSSLNTEALLETIDAISKRFDGFYFGRYDVRTPNSNSLAQGKHVKILELNGVTSEATHVYHPATPLVNAWRTLMSQWKIAFQIGAINASNGHSPASLLEFARLIRQYCHREKFEA
ncbi:MAG: alpha/beta fold hydrolase [Verrucomicrobiota bacterium]